MVLRKYEPITSILYATLVRPMELGKLHLASHIDPVLEEFPNAKIRVEDYELTVQLPFRSREKKVASQIPDATLLSKSFHYLAIFL